jgi:hypothetical protein
MSGEIVQILTNSVGAVAVAVVSFFYMNKMADRFAKTVDQITNNYVAAKTAFTEKMQKLTDSIDSLNRKICEQADWLKQMYVQNAKLYEENKSFKTGKKKYRFID